MKLFKSYTYSWWQIGVFKLALLLIGMAIGAYWYELFISYLTPLIITAAVLSVYIILESLKQK